MNLFRAVWLGLRSLRNQMGLNLVAPRSMQTALIENCHQISWVPEDEAIICALHIF